MSTISTHDDARGDESLRGIARRRLAAFRTEEAERFAKARPRSRAIASTGTAFYAGVPLHWMLDWELPFPLVVAEAHGSTLIDVDGHRLADFCLGDTGAMFGHSPEPVARALAAQAGRGLAFMLPTEHAVAVGLLLRERFGLPHWQVATTASDANRFALRVARAVTGRRKIVIMNGCYHGAVDETYVRLSGGRTVHGAGLIGQFEDLTAATAAVEFNDIAALERALGAGDVACVITEPVLTNCCMVLPDAGYHRDLRRVTRASGTLLLIDETHTISSGPSGYCGAHALEPDIFVLGKPVAGGVPASVWGFTDAVALGWDRVRRATPAGHSGLGTTLSANALAMATMRATLSEVMTASAYRHMEALALRLHDGLAGVIARHRLRWHVVRVGARVEFICAPGPLRNGSEAAAAQAPELERALHLGLLNRGCAIAPFHNMMLVCPATSVTLVGGFGEVVAALVG